MRNSWPVRWDAGNHVVWTGALKEGKPRTLHEGRSYMPHRLAFAGEYGLSGDVPRIARVCAVEHCIEPRHHVLAKHATSRLGKRGIKRKRQIIASLRLLSMRSGGWHLEGRDCFGVPGHQAMLFGEAEGIETLDVLSAFRILWEKEGRITDTE
jgi:hypothetical protein